jgi:hypothetical protein
MFLLFHHRGQLDTRCSSDGFHLPRTLYQWRTRRRTKPFYQWRTRRTKPPQNNLTTHLCMNAKIQLLFHLARSKPSMRITSSSMYGIIYLTTCAEQVRTSSITLVKSQQNWSLRRLRIAMKKWRTCNPYNHEQGFCPKVKMVMSTTNDIYSFKKTTNDIYTPRYRVTTIT